MGFHPMQEAKASVLVGRCVYCPTPVPERGQLTKEHAIPESIGGRYILRHGSCTSCAKDIQQTFEDHVIRKFFFIHRGVLQLKTGTGRRRGFIRFRDPKTGRHHEPVAVNDHPGVVLCPLFPAPGILRHNDTARREQTRLLPYTLVPDAAEKLRRLGGQLPIGSFGESDFVKFRLFLAKIAHGIAAHIWKEHFAPYTIPLIRGLPSNHVIDYFVGCDWGDADSDALYPPGKHLHEWDLGFARRPGNSQLVEIKIRLFAKYGAPTYMIIPGHVENSFFEIKAPRETAQDSQEGAPQ